MKTITRRQSVLNDLSLQARSNSPSQNQLPRSSRPISLDRLPAGVFLAVPSVEITVGLPATQLISQSIAKVSHPELRSFLTAVAAEPEVAQALSTPAASASRSTLSFQSYPVQTLRRAAELASYWCAYGQIERDVLFAATFIAGIGHLLAGSVIGNSSLDDILFTLVRPHLHRLDGSAPRQASLLRLALGWGNADEVDAWYVPRLQEAVARALSAVQLGQFGSNVAAR